MFRKFVKNLWIGIRLISIESKEIEMQEPNKIKDGNTEWWHRIGTGM
jgi:hypothetical protein